MRREEVQHLLGGYAAGTLTPAEQKLLFEAAMEDQSLFDAMADEQALKELLDDPEARGYLRAALEEPSQSVVPAKQAWWPKAAAISAFAAVLTVVTVVGIRQTTGGKQAAVSKPVEVAQQSSSSPPSPAVAETQRGEASVPKRKEAPRKVIESEARAAAASPVASREADAAPVAEDKKKEEVAAAVPPPRPAVALERAEPRDAELAKAAPAPAPLSARAPMTIQLSASELFLTQYRQNFLPTSNMGGTVQTLGRMRDSSTAQRKQSSAETQQQRNPAPAEDRLSQRVPGAPAAEYAAAVSNRGIRYQILRRNSQGNLVQTRLDTRFEAGDEIQLQVEKNAPGVVSVFSGTSPVALANQSESSALTAPLRLTEGTLDLSIVFAQAAATGLQPPAAAQVTERSGNLMYVVLPGVAANPVVASFRITVYK